MGMIYNSFFAAQLARKRSNAGSVGLLCRSVPIIC
jgi:hypothetical protein